MLFLGVDPGLSSGGIAAITVKPDLLVSTVDAMAWKMPQTETDLVELLQRIIFGEALIKPRGDVFAVVEKVWGFPGTLKKVRCPRCGHFQTVRQTQGIASTSKFMTNYGVIKGVLAAMMIPREFVTPNAWQKVLGLINKDKNAHKARAQELFPKLRVIHATADALLLAHFARLTHNSLKGATK